MAAKAQVASRPRHSSFRWVAVGFLLILSLINYGDRGAMGVLAKPIMATFHLTPVAFGVIAGAFSFGYAPFNLIGGILGDRYSPSRILQIASAVWSFALISVATATGYTYLFVTRLIFGAAEGPNFTLDTKLMSRWLPKTERARGLSFATVGAPLGIAISAPIIGVLFGGVGWRGVFIIIGLVGLLWFGASFFLLKDWPRESRHVAESELAVIELNEVGSTSVPESTDDNVSVSWGQILGNGALQSTAWAYFAFAYTNYMMITWLPTYFADVHHLTLENSAFAAAVPWLGAALGTIVAGFVSDAVLKRTHDDRKARGWIIGFGLILVGIFTFAASRTDNGTLAMVLLTAGMFCEYSTNGIYWVIPPTIFPQKAVGRATGYMQLIASLPGFIAPAITGAIVGGVGGFNAAFLLAAVIAVAGGLLGLFGIRPKPLKV